jgi:hypothetical protein
MFVCECKEDYKLMHRLFADTTEALGRKAVINTWFRPKDAPADPPPMDEAEVRDGRTTLRSVNPLTICFTPHAATCSGVRKVCA